VKNIDYGCAFPASGVPARAGGTNCVRRQGRRRRFDKALRGIVRYNQASNHSNCSDCFKSITESRPK